jgi:hypothetical protein
MNHEMHPSQFGPNVNLNQMRFTQAHTGTNMLTVTNLHFVLHYNLSLSVRGDTYIFLRSHFGTKSFFFCVIFSILEHPRSSLSVPPLQASTGMIDGSTEYAGASKRILIKHKFELNVTHGNQRQD